MKKYVQFATCGFYWGFDLIFKIYRKLIKYSKCPLIRIKNFDFQIIKLSFFLHKILIKFVADCMV